MPRVNGTEKAPGNAGFTPSPELGGWGCTSTTPTLCTFPPSRLVKSTCTVAPKGTVIHVSAWYDNTRANLFNPDPDQWVGYGDRTVDEMGHAWMNVVYLNDDEYKALLAERKAKAEKKASNQTR